MPSSSTLFPPILTPKSDHRPRTGETADMGSPKQSDPAGHLLELAACDDLAAFRRRVEADGLLLDVPALWYGRWWSASKGPSMGHELRTPLMVAALYGSASIVRYILSTAVDVNRACGSDSATALHCCAAGGASSSLDVAVLLVAASADIHKRDASGRMPADVIARQHPSARRLRANLEAVLRGEPVGDVAAEEEKEKEKRKEYPVDATLPDINSGVYGTDDFRMYCFKVRPCSRAYTHDWTECPYAHPGENARRRDPRKHQYSCVPCPDFRKSGACRSGDACEYAHGVFESWLHPQQYRTRLCKDEVGCARRVCFFAHKPEELRAPAPCPYATSPPTASSPACSSPRSAALPPLDLGAAAAALLLNQQQQQQQQQQELSSMLAFEEELSSILAQMKPPKQSPPKQHLLTSAILNNSRASAFAKRSHSFIDRGAAAAAVSARGQQTSGYGGAAPSRMVPGWGSPGGKADWGIGGEELSKLRRSASFGMRGVQPVIEEEEPDVSWVQSLVGDGKGRTGGYPSQLPSWGGDHSHLYLEQGRIFA